jgi:predicted O-methyltransferase YrrM
MNDVQQPADKHQFSFDWFSWKIPLFERHLAHLKDMPCSMLEIGSFEGRSATWLMENIATNAASRLLCVDLYEQPFFWSNIEASQVRERVALKIGPSSEILRTLPTAAYDFVYIDGSHDAVPVLEDAVLGFMLAKPGAIIAFDDYLWDDPNYVHVGTPKASIDAFTNIYALQIDILEYGEQVWVRKRVG